MKINKDVREFLSKISKDGHKAFKKRDPEGYRAMQKAKSILAIKALKLRKKEGVDKSLTSPTD